MASSTDEVLDGNSPVRAVGTSPEQRLAPTLGRLALYEGMVAALGVIAQQVAGVADVDELIAAAPFLALALYPRAGAALLQVALDGSVRILSRAGPSFEAPHWIEAEARVLAGAAAGRDAARGRRSGRAVLLPVGRPSERRVLAVERDAADGSAQEEVEPLAVLASLMASALESARAAGAQRDSDARAAAVLAATEEGVLLLDRDAVVRGANDRAIETLRVPRERVVARPLRDVPGLAPLCAAAGARGGLHLVALPGGEAAVRVEGWDGGAVVTLRPICAERAPRRSSAPASRYTFDDLVGEAPAFLRVIDEARRAAASDLPVLVCGESGTGKELVAQAIHHASPRAAEPFVGINVTAIPHDLLESELFGYEGGAFTGASTGGHAGKFELAGAGTVLLDEIGDMPVETQPKLLRVLQERLLQRVGSARDIRVRARIVATSHRDLPEAVSTGRLRLDLFHRLCVIHLHLPPLRERRSDVPLIVEHQLRLHAERTGRRVRMAPHLLDALQAYDWPGNVRELVNLLEGELCVLPAGEDVLTREPKTLLRAAMAVGASDALACSLDELERRACADTLARLGGDVARAAIALGVPKRTLYAKMKRWGLRGRGSPLAAPHESGPHVV